MIQDLQGPWPMGYAIVFYTAYDSTHDALRTSAFPLFA